MRKLILLAMLASFTMVSCVSVESGGAASSDGGTTTSGDSSDSTTSEGRSEESFSIEGTVSTILSNIGISSAHAKGVDVSTLSKDDALSIYKDYLSAIDKGDKDVEAENYSTLSDYAVYSKITIEDLLDSLDGGLDDSGSGAGKSDDDDKKDDDDSEKKSDHGIDVSKLDEEELKAIYTKLIEAKKDESEEVDTLFSILSDYAKFAGKDTDEFLTSLAESTEIKKDDDDSEKKSDHGIDVSNLDEEELKAIYSQLIEAKKDESEEAATLFSILSDYAKFAGKDTDEFLTSLAELTETKEDDDSKVKKVTSTTGAKSSPLSNTLFMDSSSDLSTAIISLFKLYVPAADSSEYVVMPGFEGKKTETDFPYGFVTYQIYTSGDSAAIEIGIVAIDSNGKYKIVPQGDIDEGYLVKVNATFVQNGVTVTKGALISTQLGLDVPTTLQVNDSSNIVAQEVVAQLESGSLNAADISDEILSVTDDVTEISNKVDIGDIKAGLATILSGYNTGDYKFTSAESLDICSIIISSSDDVLTLEYDISNYKTSDSSQDAIDALIESALSEYVKYHYVASFEEISTAISKSGTASAIMKIASEGITTTTIVEISDDSDSEEKKEEEKKEEEKKEEEKKEEEKKEEEDKKDDGKK